MDTLSRRRIRALGSAALAAALGGMAWSGGVLVLALSFGFLVIVLALRSRWAAYAVAFAYYTGSAWSLVPGAATFFGFQHSLVQAVLLWLSASAILAAPWGLLFCPARFGRLWLAPLALAATTVPPLGLIGWASPLTAAGILFPGTGWGGILAVAFLPALIILRPRIGASLLVVLIAFSWVTCSGDVRLSDPWEGVNTTFGGGQLQIQDPLHEFRTAEWIQKRALTSNAKVIVFPESAVPRWNQATEAFWEPTFTALAARGKTIVFGATVSVAASQKLLNVVIIRGAGTPASFLQRVPVPISMWKPLRDEGMPLRLAGPGTIQVAGQRATILVCYELLLTWPVLASSLEHPTVLVGVANDYWAKQTPIPACQRAALTSWARLFRLPKVMAANL